MRASALGRASQRTGRCDAGSRAPLDRELRRWIASAPSANAMAARDGRLWQLHGGGELVVWRGLAAHGEQITGDGHFDQIDRRALGHAFEVLGRIAAALELEH